uniref:PlsC domain-containing protein n=1 Tax=Globodera pallida TaxID=36090 RepID=A0A183CC76_GLOPA
MSLLLLATAEHLLVLSAFFFPPALIIVLLVVILATFGKSLGLRERYISMLIRIFEWGAGEIQNRRKKSGVVTGSSIFELGDCYATSDEELEEECSGSAAEFGEFSGGGGGGAGGGSSDSGRSGAGGHYCSMDLASMQSPTDSGLAPSPLARSMNSMPSLRKASSAHHGSLTSLCSTSSARSARARHGSGQSIIIRETSIHHLDDEEYQFQTLVNSRGWQGIRDSMYFIKAGVEAIIEDDVTSRFKAEQLASWNMLTRTSVSFYHFLSWKLTILWGVGFMFRYMFMLPMRLVVFSVSLITVVLGTAVVGLCPNGRLKRWLNEKLMLLNQTSWKLTILWGLGFMFRYMFMLPMRLVVFSVSLITVVLGTAVVGLCPNGRLKRWLNEKLMLVVMRIGSRAFSALIYFHDRENKAKCGGICVANHTSPIDVMILGSDTAYALIGQQHGGVLGLIQRALSRASSHIWFERSESKDRSLARKRLVVMRIGSRAFSALIYFHDRENKAKCGGICVANHTSPIDVMILGSDTAYALIGQQHGGVLGLIQRALSRASSHIWFERSESKDRSLVRKRLFDHVQDPTKLPVLIFPEGTCINNTSVMMFKKGCFEVNAPIYPIAMKYDTRFGDAFWNSSEQSYFRYLLQMMTSWALICHVWYLPPMMKEPGESAIDLANRVKKAIAVRGGLVDLEWDGQLKRSKVPARMVDEQRES